MILALPFACRPTVAYSGASLRTTIRNIIPIGPEKVMPRIAARRVVACMQYLKSTGYRAIGQYPRNAVCESFAVESISATKAAIAGRLRSSQPRPARIGATGHIDRGPKLLNDPLVIIASGKCLLALMASLTQAAFRAIRPKDGIENVARQVSLASVAIPQGSSERIVPSQKWNVLPSHVPQVVTCSCCDRGYQSASATAHTDNLDAILRLHSGNLLYRFVGCRAPGRSRVAGVFACLNYTAFRHEMAVSA
jgi:hypothetical protein